jgi:hypothetical protein
MIAAPIENALDGLKFSVQAAPALVTLAVSTPTVTETVTFSVGSDVILDTAQINLEIANQTVDRDRDVLLEQEVVPAGQYFLQFPACAADISYLLLIEPVV